MPNVFIGTSGFQYWHWQKVFYPNHLKPKDYLKFYARYFLTVEINSSFYHIPHQKTIKNWLSQTSKDFVFSFKMSRFVTHFGKLDSEVKSFKLFFNALKPLTNSPIKHLILIQTPVSFKINLEKLKKFIKNLPKNFLYAFEFRHPSWFCSKLYQIFKKENFALVLSDNPLKNKTQHLWPYVNIDTANFFYIRFHGSKILFTSSYSDKELKFYAQLIKEKLKKQMKVFCYFNNDAKGYAIENALFLKKLLKI